MIFLPALIALNEKTMLDRAFLKPDTDRIQREKMLLEHMSVYKNFLVFYNVIREKCSRFLGIFSWIPPLSPLKLISNHVTAGVGVLLCYQK